MDAYIINMPDNVQSRVGTNGLIMSMAKHAPRVNPILEKAVTPTDLRFDQYKDLWNYPWGFKELDRETDLLKTPYKTSNPSAHVCCSISHYLLWKKAAQLMQPIMVLEHDALFTCKFNLYGHDVQDWDVVGINDPRGNTRKSGVYHQGVQDLADKQMRINQVVVVPWVSYGRRDIPQGLAGNSAYIITPSGGRRLVKLVEQYGLWPNDALMCKQLMDDLGQTHTYYTTTQHLESTTT